MPIAAAAAATEESHRTQVTPGAEFLYRVAERFGLPVVILVLVLYWARTDIVQPLLDAHFDFIETIVEGQDENTRQIQELGRKLDAIIKIQSNK